MPLSAPVRALAKPAKPPLPETGTSVAIKTNYWSDAADSSLSAVRSWGGARNRGDRISSVLSLAQTTDLFGAAATASALGLPLNRHITVHWEKAGVPDRSAAAATGALIKLASQFLHSRGWRFAYVWVRENDSGNGHKGSHVHILAHVPPDAAAAFVAMQRRWLRRVTGRAYRKGVVLSRRIGGGLRTATTAPELHRVNLAKLITYLAKGASADTARVFGLKRSEEGGRVIGKRASRSQNLSQLTVPRPLAKYDCDIARVHHGDTDIR